MEGAVPRQSARGPRLWLQPARPKPNGSVERAVWCIRDDEGRKVSTGCGIDDREQAENILADYIASKRLTTRARNSASHQVAIADVIAIYAADVAPRHARPKEVAGRLERLLMWWGAKTLAHVTGRSCRAYVEHRGTPAAARRELEDLRAAINYHRAEGLCREVVEVVLPPRSSPRVRWMTRNEIARLVWTAWRKREMQDGKPTRRKPWAHIARFILLAVYTGTRASTVCRSSFKQKDGFGWIDLERGVWYRRPESETETKKRRPPVPLTPRLQAHLGRWSKKQAYPVQFRGQAVLDVDKAFRMVATEAGLPDVTPHVTRHTSATWLMQAGVDMWEAAGYLGMTVQTLERVYGHHHPAHLAGAVKAMNKSGRQLADKNNGKDQESFGNIVIQIEEKLNKINGQ